MRVLKAHAGKVNSILARGKVLISSGSDHDIKIWNLVIIFAYFLIFQKTKGTCMYILKNGKEITSLCLGDSKALYVSSKDGTVCFFVFLLIIKIRKWVLPDDKQMSDLWNQELEQETHFDGVNNL